MEEILGNSYEDRYGDIYTVRGISLANRIFFVDIKYYIKHGRYMNGVTTKINNAEFIGKIASGAFRKVDINNTPIKEVKIDKKPHLFISGNL